MSANSSSSPPLFVLLSPWGRNRREDFGEGPVSVLTLVCLAFSQKRSETETEKCCRFRCISYRPGCSVCLEACKSRDPPPSCLRLIFVPSCTKSPVVVFVSGSVPPSAKYIYGLALYLNACAFVRGENRQCYLSCRFADLYTLPRAETTSTLDLFLVKVEPLIVLGRGDLERGEGIQKVDRGAKDPITNLFQRRILVSDESLKGRPRRFEDCSAKTSIPSMAERRRGLST
jgi:hypothetical protein